MKKNLLKTLMEKAFLSFVVLMGVSFALASCGDDVEDKVKLDNSAPDKVTNVTAVSGPGEVTLSWTNPSSSSFMYTKVVYKDAKKNTKYVMVSKERNATATVKGFANTEAQTFLLYACAVNGGNAGAVEVTASPGMPAYLEVVKTITIQPALGGVLVNYENTYPTTVLVALEYSVPGDAMKIGSTKFEVEGNSQGARLVRLSYGENQSIAGEEVSINVTTEDEYENASEVVTHKVIPIEAVKIDRTNWSFPGYDAGSNSTTIGYSSQEAKGEGNQDGLPNGRVVSMIDSSLKTFWHASWKEATDYPHWFILDMGKDVTVASVELTRRQGNDKGQKGQHIYTCSDAGAADKGNPDSWKWTDHGSFSFDTTKDAPQSFGLATTPKARYIKIYFGKEHKGNGNFAMLSDLNVYGLE